jgi:hydrogenase maturation protease
MPVFEHKADIVIIGLGNDILRDDGVGIHIAQDLEYSFPHDIVTVKTAAVGGIDLLHLLAGHRLAIIIDAMVTGKHPPGTVLTFNAMDIPEPTEMVMSHNLHLPTAMEFGAQLGFEMPAEVKVIGIEAKDYQTFGERKEMSREVSGAMPEVKRIVGEMVKRYMDGNKQQ